MNNLQHVLSCFIPDTGPHIDSTLIKMCFQSTKKHYWICQRLSASITVSHPCTWPERAVMKHTHILIPGLTRTHSYHIPEWTVIAAIQPEARRAITADYHPHSQSCPVSWTTCQCTHTLQPYIIGLQRSREVALVHLQSVTKRPFIGHILLTIDSRPGAEWRGHLSHGRVSEVKSCDGGKKKNQYLNACMDIIKIGCILYRHTRIDFFFIEKMQSTKYFWSNV